MQDFKNFVTHVCNAYKDSPKPKACGSQPCTQLQFKWKARQTRDLKQDDIKINAGGAESLQSPPIYICMVCSIH